MANLRIELLPLSDEEFVEIARFSFELFVSELAKSSGRKSEEIRKEAGAPPLERSKRDIWRKIVCDGESCGYGWIKTGPASDEAFAYEIYIKEEFRGRGIGRKTLNLAIELLGSLGIKKLKLCVFEDNKRGKGLYDSLGFKLDKFDEKRRQAHMSLIIG